jgi:transcriptional regulator with XRE-family HTH domain
VSVFTNNIRAVRASKNISRPKLAEKIGVHYNTLRNWELGIADPKAQNIVAISKALECSVEDLLVIDGD